LSFILAVVSIYLFLRSKKEKKPMFCIRSINLIGDLYNKISGLEIYYKDNPVSNVFSTNIAFWNNGQEVINKNDISQTEKLRIVFPKGKILDKEIVTTTCNSINFNIEQKNENELILSFDFLEKNDGAVVNLLHTSKSLKDIKFIGKIKGVKISSLSEKNGNGPKGSNRRNLMNLIFILLAYTLLSFFAFPIESLIDPQLGNYSGLLSSISVLIIYLYLIYSEVKMPEKIYSYMNTTGSTPEKVNS
jgi:hypothetical protein